ncbi:BPTI/Kunitz domain-containing protein [Trichomycterus rosablanca]|uniref:BPTI/Kunitz domain-containing protein n=1 Tax=Trichomycterus rosablanca TaxID=2290929 RepID=UPI002F351E26
MYTESTLLAFCDLPKDEGSGSDIKVYMYYNKTADRCYPFRFTGSGGNENRFIAEKYCMRNCSQRAEELYPVDETKACHLPKTPGECYGTYLRYYYDAVHGKCKAFFWTGCIGNGNRFMELERCNDTCFGIIDEGNGDIRDEEVESDTPVGIILGVTLGIIGAIILIVVLVLSLKKKKPSKSKASKAKQEAKKDPNTPGPEIPLQTENTEMA